MRDKRTGRFHTFHRGDAVFHVPRQFRHFRERPLGVLLDHPNIRASTIDDQRGLLNETTVDSAHTHDNHQQQADAKRRQHESPKLETDILEGQIHGSCTSALRPMCGK